MTMSGRFRFDMAQSQYMYTYDVQQLHVGQCLHDQLLCIKAPGMNHAISHMSKHLHVY